jgi:hypothetical protein
MMNHCLQRVVAIACLVTSVMAPVTFAAGQEPLKSLSALTVVDANEKKVGSVFSLSLTEVGTLNAMVVFDVEEQPFVVLVSTNRFFGSSAGPYFASGNCSGLPLVGSLNMDLIPLAIVAAPGKTAYVVEPDATPQHFDAFQGTRLTPDGTCQPVSGGITLTAARAVVDLGIFFTPPFSVR